MTVTAYKKISYFNSIYFRCIKKWNTISCFLILIPAISFSQTVDYEAITTSKPLQVSGSVSASSVFYESNYNNNRAPFTYYLQGGINVNVYSFSVPITFSYSNQGSDLGYKLPFDFNRLSLHPKYKWITGHIGNVNMSFSPYTLNGHQFTGGGIDLTPEGAIKVSAMTGRLLRATADDGDPKTLPAFSRMGYGLKTRYEQEKIKIGVIGFYAKDDINSIPEVPEERGILPKENLVLSIDGDISITETFSLQGEYASSAVTKDLRAEDTDEGQTGVAAMFFNSKVSTEYFKAYRVNLNYSENRTSIGIGYERIDPGYETLGAYFFNNDFENITLNASRTLFKDKLALSFNIGYQRDDLENQKANASNRIVGSVNANYNHSERLNLTGSYSNFSTYTNVKPNQFDDINDDNLLDEDLEDLNYKQLSQNATLNVNYILSNEEKLRQNLNFNYALNDVANSQGGIVRIGDASTFHNASAGYNVNFPEQNLNLTAAVNYTYNTIGREDATTWGPTLGVGKRFFDKKMNTRLAASYNESESTAGKSSVSNLRGSVSYLLKEKHNFNLNMIQLFRNGGTSPNISEFTATFGYNYVFGIKKPKFGPGRQREDRNFMKISHEDYYFEGSPEEISMEARALIPPKDAKVPKQKRADLELLIRAVSESESKDKKKYKESVINYLDALIEYRDFMEKYDQWIYSAYLKLIAEAEQIDSDLQAEYTTIQARVNTYNRQEDKEELLEIDKKFTAHSIMLSNLRKWNLTLEEVKNPEGELKKLKEAYFDKIYLMFKNGRPENNIIDYIEVRLADIYHKVLQERE